MIGGRVVSWIESPGGLVCLFALGLAIRLILARHSGGLQFDVSLFRQWSDRLVLRGPAHFYEPGDFAGYPPGYLFVLLALGQASRVMSGEPPSLALLKLPAIIADLGVAALALLLPARLTPGGGGRPAPRRATAAAAILLNPGLIL